jgi:hypothetical protein
MDAEAAAATGGVSSDASVLREARSKCWQVRAQAQASQRARTRSARRF